MMLLDKKKIILFALGLIISVSALVFMYSIFKGFNNDSRRLIGLKKELSTFQNKRENLESAQKAYLSWQISLEKIDSMFIDADAPIDFIKFMEKTSRDCGLSSDISSNSSIAESDSWSYLSFQISLTGRFENVLKFLEKVETAPYFITEDSLTIRDLSSSDEYDQGDVEAILEIKAYTK